MTDIEAEALEAVRELVKRGDISANWLRSRLTFRQAEAILNPQLMSDKVITPEEFSKRAGISITTIWRLRRRGELKFMQLSPRRVGIRLRDAEAWLAARNDSLTNIDAKNRK